MNGSISWGNGVSKVYTLTETMGKKDHLSVRAISCILIAVLHCYTSLQAYKVFFFEFKGRSTAASYKERKKASSYNCCDYINN